MAATTYNSNVCWHINSIVYNVISHRIFWDINLTIHLHLIYLCILGRFSLGKSTGEFQSVIVIAGGVYMVVYCLHFQLYMYNVCFFVFSVI